MLDHLGLEVSDLASSGAFYDAVFFPLGVRRMFESERAVAYGVNDARFWITARDRPPQATFGHVAFEASGKAAVDAAYEGGLGAGGRSDGPPGPRRQYGPRYYAAYLLDPDGHRIEVVAGSR
jgi:catechol 2,3-dioxygenase-like lactoylglutathione lyase family enzyme